MIYLRILCNSTTIFNDNCKTNIIICKKFFGFSVFLF